MCVCEYVYLYTYASYARVDLDLNHISTRSLPTQVTSQWSQDFFQAVPASITLAIYPRHSAGEALLWEEGKAPIAADSASVSTVSRSLAAAFFLWKKDRGKHMRATL